jgi:hypothetical protein
MKNVEQVLSAKQRVEAGKQIKPLNWNFALWLITSIAITVATGVILWASDEDKVCKAPNSHHDRTISAQANWIDVGRRFRDVLKIFFACAITDVFRSVIMIIAVNTQNGSLATLYQVLTLNDVVGFGAIFVLHAFRFSLSGKICAGDYSDDTTNYPYSGQYLSEQGAYLLGLVVFVWVWGIFLTVLSTCIMLWAYKPFIYGICGKIANAWRSVSLLHRMGKGNQNDLLNIQFTFQALSSLAIFVSVAAYLWSKEVNNTCLAPYYYIQPSELVQVGDRFRDILKIWWTFGLVDFFRNLVALIAVSMNSRCLAWLYQVFILNDLLGVAAVIILHAYRFQYSGQWCSGDFLDDDRQSRPGYLI